MAFVSPLSWGYKGADRVKNWGNSTLEQLCCQIVYLMIVDLDLGNLSLHSGRCNRKRVNTFLMVFSNCFPMFGFFLRTFTHWLFITEMKKEALLCDSTRWSLWSNVLLIFWWNINQNKKRFYVWFLSRTTIKNISNFEKVFARVLFDFEKVRPTATFLHFFYFSFVWSTSADKLISRWLANLTEIECPEFHQNCSILLNRGNWKKPN